MATKLKIEKRGDEILIVHCCFSIRLKNDNIMKIILVEMIVVALFR
jgi:hypothetical protein